MGKAGWNGCSRWALPPHIPEYSQGILKGERGTLPFTNWSRESMFSENGDLEQDIRSSSVSGGENCIALYLKKKTKKTVLLKIFDPILTRPHCPADPGSDTDDTLVHKAPAAPSETSHSESRSQPPNAPSLQHRSLPPPQRCSPLGKLPDTQISFACVCAAKSPEKTSMSQFKVTCESSCEPQGFMYAGRGVKGGGSSV